MACRVVELWQGTRRVLVFCKALVLFALVAVKAAAAPAPVDTLKSFEASFYYGIGIDSFAASDLNRYLNPGRSGEVLTRGIGGFAFAHELPKPSWAATFWLYGETRHGVRSADLDLSGLDSLAAFKLTGYTAPGNRALYIIRNATSLEASIGLRLALKAFTPPESDARLYLFSDYGFVTVNGAGQDVLDISNYGAGLISVRGDLCGSRLEASIGRSDFFIAHHMTRFKVHGLLNWTNTLMKAHAMGMFAEMVVDSDLGPGSDSVQSYLGFAFNLKRFLEGKSGEQQNPDGTEKAEEP